MKEKDIIVGLDVGTTKVCTIIGQRNSPNNLEIIGIGTHPSHGLKKGSVVNIEKTVHSIQHSVEEAKLMAGVQFTHATIGIAGGHIYSFNSTGAVPIKNKEITALDIENVHEAAKAIVIPADREILHVIPQEYRVDNIRGVKNPLGMCGVRLEVNVHIVTGSISLIQNLIKCVEQTGIIAEQITLQPIASSRSVLSEEEKDLGVVLIDIGGGTTDIAIWKDNSLLHSQIIPVGGNHFTNDLAVALKIPHAEAERIKINHGSVLAEVLNQSSHITVQGMAGTKRREIPLKVVAEVLGARAEELFRIVKSIVDEKGLAEQISGGFVLTGGGAMIKSISELAEYILMKPTKLGFPGPFGGMTNVMQNPQFSTVLGLLLESSDYHHQSLQEDEEDLRPESNGLIGKLGQSIGQSIKSVFREIF